MTRLQLNIVSAFLLITGMILFTPTRVFAQEECQGVNFKIQMLDVHDDGWNGATYEIIDQNGVTVATGTMDDGSIAEEQFCLETGCMYAIIVGGGTHDHEIIWSLSPENEDPLLFGGAPVSKVFDIQCYFDCYVTMDEYETMMSYNEEALSCVKPGCTDPVAVNYSEDATLNDGSCRFNGCTYAFATNYNSLANHDDGSCAFASNPVCPTDLNNDNITGTADLLIFLGQFGNYCE